ncbi:MAG: methyltransferase domain-containing protein [Candidatus Cloacimonetes bacterium]|nr:methyltransferase domain-containing protein [Candidatus Cloacimonadota bacterium]
MDSPSAYFHHERMKYTNHSEHYRIDAEVFDYLNHDRVGVDETRRRQTVLRLAGRMRGKNVLEVGSGCGWFCKAAAARGAKVTAVDLSQRNLDRIKAADPRIDTRYGDACDLPCEGMAFDLITANEVLEHLEKPQHALDHWRRFLAPGGRLLVSVPYRERIRYSLCIHCNRKTPVNAHLHSFDEQKLRAMIETTGYRVRRVMLYNNKALSALRLNRLLAPFPWWFWRLKDALWNRMTGKAALMSVVGER